MFLTREIMNKPWYFPKDKIYGKTKTNFNTNKKYNY